MLYIIQQLHNFYKSLKGKFYFVEISVAALNFVRIEELMAEPKKVMQVLKNDEILTDQMEILSIVSVKSTCRSREGLVSWSDDRCAGYAFEENSIQYGWVVEVIG